MDAYLIRVRDAVAALDETTDPDHDAVHLGLVLAERAWPAVDTPSDAARARWAMFGPEVHDAAVALWPDRDPVAADPGGPLDDTAELRAGLVALVSAVAALLDAGAGDPTAPKGKRWVWAYAAARLRQAGADLAGPP